MKNIPHKRSLMKATPLRMLRLQTYLFQPQITAASLLILLSKLPAGVLFTAVTALAKSTPTAMKKILMKVLPSVWRLSCASWMSSVFPVWKT